jgi:translation initiation factor 1
MPRHRPAGSLVYSTELGRTCPDCRRSLTGCRCRQTGAAPVGDGIVRVGRESKGRGGKVMTLVTGLPLAATELAALATRLKKGCGTGGTVKDGVIEIQGEHRDAIVERLLALGYRAKRAG